jgi:Anti-sigma factor NepR
MFAAFATRTASAVGADTATASGTPTAAAFWIISTETRLVKTTKPFPAIDSAARQRAGKLVERVVTADVLTDPLRSRQEVDRQQANTAAHMSICVFCYPICYPTPAPVGMGRQPRARSHFDAVRTSVGTALRSLYSNMLNEQLPGRIAELLRQLDQQLSRLAQQKDADST